MITLSELLTRIARALDDADGKRFSSALLTEAVRLALATFDQRLPRLMTTEIEIAAEAKTLLLAALPDCLYLVNLRIRRGAALYAELEPEGEFTYQFEEEQLRLHFCKRFPRAGDTLEITYAASHRIEGLDDAEATSLPAAYESALVIGSAGHACLLRATRLTEAYGTRPTETNRLMEISQLRLDEFGRTLGNLKVLQEFGFPPGFRLDEEDSLHRGSD